MSEAKYGEGFIKHEFDEAIAIQEAIVEGERELATRHPVADVKRTLKGLLKEDDRFLKDLRRLGQEHDASGVAEEVAEPLVTLMRETASSAGEAESEAYEAHAVLLALKRKQQDSAAAMLMIAREQGDADLRDLARAFERGQKASADTLSESLGTLAVHIALADSAAA
jgi:hypothetical protein